MDTLYHYCSTSAFHSIVNNKVLWLSSLTQSNDYMEGKLVATAITRLATQDGLGTEDIRRLQMLIEVLEKTVVAFGFCLSEAGDLLSQWRGYAADATGVAIGFSKEYLVWLSEQSRSGMNSSFSIEQVRYDRCGQDELVSPAYAEYKRLLHSNIFKAPGRTGLLDLRSDEEVRRDDDSINNGYELLFASQLALIPKLFLLKSAAFSEELEWRLLAPQFKAIGGEFSYRAGDSQIIPYRSYDLCELQRLPIKEVVLGPKHKTPAHVVSDFLRSCGFGSVVVRQSEATYR